MSFNVRLLNQYQWIEDHDIEGKILLMIQNERPDILMLQEFREGATDFRQKLGYNYHCFKPSMHGQYGSVIFSKYPIKESKIITIENDSSANNSFQYADIEWQGKLIRFFNVHLASVGLEDADYALLENPNGENQEQLEKGLRSIAGSLNRAFKRKRTPGQFDIA